MKHLSFDIVLLAFGASSCYKAQGQGQDAIQIVAKAALCFDNQTVITNCLATLGVGGTTTMTTTIGSSIAGFCSGPCYGQTMLMIGCIDGMLSNFQFYNAQMMMGLQSVFQTACGNSSPSTSSSSGSGNLEAVSNYGNKIAQLPHKWSMGILASLVLL